MGLETVREIVGRGAQIEDMAGLVTSFFLASELYSRNDDSFENFLAMIKCSLQR